MKTSVSLKSHFEDFDAVAAAWCALGKLNNSGVFWYTSYAKSHRACGCSVARGASGVRLAVRLECGWRFLAVALVHLVHCDAFWFWCIWSILVQLHPKHFGAFWCTLVQSGAFWCIP